MGLYENLLGEPVKSLALRPTVLLSPHETVRVGIERMRDKHLGCVIVIDDQKKPIGMLTENMLTQLCAKDPSVVDDPVEVHMARNFPWVTRTDPVVDVVEALETKNVRFLCVVNEEGRVVALTGQKGIMEYVADHYPGQVMVQRVGVAPYSYTREGA